jgi:hypothetical protein
MGQSGHDQSLSLGTQIPLGSFEDGLEPQTTTAQKSLIASIAAIYLPAMPVVQTTGPSMGDPPRCEKHDKEPAVQMFSIGKAAALDKAPSAFIVLKNSFHFHTSGILSHTCM